MKLQNQVHVFQLEREKTAGKIKFIIHIKKKGLVRDLFNVCRLFQVFSFLKNKFKKVNQKITYDSLLLKT